MTLLLAILLGFFFGFVLQRIGAADPQKIIGMLTLTDMHLAKAIMTGVGLASALLFTGLLVGLIDAAHLSIKSMYNGVIIGGMVLGAGWAISGFCPGTGVVALGTGRVDAAFFVAGGLLGAGLFTVFYASFMDSWLFNELLGGKTSLAGADNNIGFAIVLAMAFIAAAKLLPTKIR